MLAKAILLAIINLSSVFRRKKFSLLSELVIMGDPLVIQPVLALGKGTITCDTGVQFGYFPSPDFYSSYTHIEARNSASRIRIGANTIFNNRLTIISESRSIIIGADCLFGFRVTILDSDFHSLEPEERRTGKPKSADVIIEDNVFVGSDVTILKGVTIGKNSVIAANSVVVSMVPANSIAAGNPAKIIGIC